MPADIEGGPTVAPRPKLTLEQKRDVGARYKAGATCKQLAELFGVSPATIRATLIGLGIERDVHFRNLTEQEIIEVVRRYKSGESHHSIASSFGVSRPAISTHIRNATRKEAGLSGRKSRVQAITKYSCNHEFFSKIDTEEKAYILGFIAADGCIIETDGSPELVIVLKECDQGHLERIARAMDLTRPVRPYEYKGYRHCRFVVRSSEIVSDLGHYGVEPRKTFTISWPDLREDLYRHYARGLFDGDGCWTIGKLRGQQKTPHLAFSLIGNAKIIPAYANCLQTATHIKPRTLSPRYGKEGELSTLNFRCEGNSLAFRIANWLYTGATIYLPRKRDIVLRHYQSLPKYRNQLRFG